MSHLSAPASVVLITGSKELQEQFRASLHGRDTITINRLEFACVDHDNAESFGLREFRRVSPVNPTAKTGWTGEGLPPAGIDVEIHNKSGRGVVEGAESFIGTTCKVLATFINMNGYEMVSVEDSGGSCMCFRADMCGPVRTPKQIAEEARESAIKDLMQVDDVYYEQAANIYDRGYRKFEITEGE